MTKNSTALLCFSLARRSQRVTLPMIWSLLPSGFLKEGVSHSVIGSIFQDLFSTSFLSAMLNLEPVSRVAMTSEMSESLFWVASTILVALIVVVVSEMDSSVMVLTLSRFFLLGLGVLPAFVLFSRELERPRDLSEAEVELALVADEARRRVEFLLFLPSRDFLSLSFFFFLLLLSLEDDEDSLEEDDDLLLLVLEDDLVVVLLEPPLQAWVACPVRPQDSHLRVFLSTVQASLLWAPLQIQHWRLKGVSES